MSLGHNEAMPQSSKSVQEESASDHRLRKRADYQRVYRDGRKQFSPSMSYFFALRSENAVIPAGPRVGLTVGRVLGKAVERNRIKRRMRDIVRRKIGIVDANVDIVLHPRKSVLTAEFAKLEREVVRILTSIQNITAGGRRIEP
jgi:ribonuclease P protein component